MAALYFMGLFIGGNKELSAQSVTPSPQVLFSVFTANTLIPGGGDLFLTSKVIHPGVDLGVEFELSKRGNNQWVYGARAGYFYHRLAQHAIQLYADCGYRRWMLSGHLTLESRLALGYLHVFPDLQVFKRSDNGSYESGLPFGRPQMMAALSLGPSYVFSPGGPHPIRVFLDYQLMIQTPFVKSYVPILPYTMVHFGVASPFLSYFNQ